MASSTTICTANTWYFVAATFDSSLTTNNCKITVDTSTTTGTINLGANTLLANTQPLSIGRWASSSNAFDGRIDEVVVANDNRPTSVDVSDLRLSRHGGAAVLS